MHSTAEGARFHTADAAAGSPMQVGEVPSDEYVGFMCAHCTSPMIDAIYAA